MPHFSQEHTVNIDMSTLSPGQTYFTLIQTVIPRPVAWVLSENEGGDYNLAPFSYFNAVCSDPAMVILSISPKVGEGEKDTRINIEARREFVIHIAHRELAQPLTQSSAPLEYGESELDQLDLTLTNFEGFRLPRLAETRVAFGCTLEKAESIGNANQCLVFGRVERLYVDDSVVETDAKGRQNFAAEKIDPIGRLGGGEYTTFGEKIFIPRPT